MAIQNVTTSLQSLLDVVNNLPNYSIQPNQIQADWNQEDISKVDYIRNKPHNLVTIPSDIAEGDLLIYQDGQINKISKNDLINEVMGGCWISFTDEDGNPTDEPYLHWTVNEEGES